MTAVFFLSLKMMLSQVKRSTKIGEIAALSGAYGKEGNGKLKRTAETDDGNGRGLALDG